MMKNQNSFGRRYFRQTALSLSLLVVFSALTPTFANTQTQTQEEIPTVQLEAMKITFKKRLHKKSEESTGLGKTVKTMDDIRDNQVMSVKDLVKDTPGVAVVEQGRGASSGFSIRGMDKNRVAVSVDGINQIQSYLVQKRQFGDGREGSGAINEVEIENISGMQISQGASGSESGSGALGGAVSFMTKSIDDVVDKDKSLGLTHKSAYSSRDKQWLHSVGIGARFGNFDALFQYTDRKKQGVEPHKDIYKTQYEVWRWAGVADDDPKRQFVMIDECPSYNANDVGSVVSCAKPKLKLIPTQETISAKDYTGDKRVLGDPMDYESGSYFGKLGYQFAGGHRLEGVFEKTTQTYNTQDMTKHAYHLVPKSGQGNLAQSPFVYRGQNLTEGLITTKGIGANWTQTQFFDEQHKKERFGLSYRFKNPKKGIFDEFGLSFDKQTVGIDHLQLEKYCSPYPIVDKNCTAGFDKPNSAQMQNRKVYTEDHSLFRTDFSKAINGDKVRHRLSGGAGYDKFSSNLWIGDVFEEYYHTDFKEEKYFSNPKGGFIDIYKTANRYDKLDVCRDFGAYVGEARKCGDRPITGHNWYANLKNTMYIGDLADVSVGVRYDKHTFKSNDDWTGTGDYHNWSWHTGLVLKPTDYLDIAYRASSGYRVPSFKELFGYRLDGLVKGENDKEHYRTNARPEKALNQEIGVSFKGDFGNVDVSYFDNHYKDLIDLTLKNIPQSGQALPYQSWGYRNYQDVRLTGITLGGKLYFASFWDKMPVGLTGKFSYMRTNVKSNDIKDNFVWASGYFLDTISPTRYVFGLDYTADSDKWGVGANWIITDPKNSSEVATLVLSPNGKSYEKQATNVSSNGWNTLDLTAFYRPNEHFTLRAGVHNALNHRYSPWEALRQTSITSGNAHNQGLPAQYAAAGRNFVLSVESKW